MTDVDPLEQSCRTCGAAPGGTCLTSAGFRCAPHAARKATRRSSLRRRPTPRAIEHRAAMDELHPLVFARDGHACVRCGTSHHLEAHHRLPTGRGGPDTLANLVTLCADDHRWVHEHPDESRAAGLLFASWDPAPTEPWRPL